MSAPDTATTFDVPICQFIRQCKSAGSELKVADSTGTEVSGSRLLIGAIAFARLLRRRHLDANEKTVGVMLPPSAGGAIVNAALALDQRAAVNLNYTLSEEDVAYCVREAKISHVIVSRKFLEKRPMKFEVPLIYVEDLRKEIGSIDKVIAASISKLPPSLIEKVFKLDAISPDDLLTIIFTSGSTGEPKGVMLSHRNVAANLKSIGKLVHLYPEDVMLGVLPFFHAFGYTATMWWPLCLTTKGIYHYNPLDARTVGELCKKYRGTFLVATPTFLRSYQKRCSPEQLGTLEVVIVGAEKLPAELRESFSAKFGVEPSEGYGATELAPVASCNIPDHRAIDNSRTATKHGTVGRPLPGQSAKIVDPESFNDRGQDEEGLLMLSGENVMRGYWNRDEKTAEVIRDGWYVTGDFARIDDEGYIHITGRQSRFSKIGGEMVPHLRIEEELSRLCGDCDEGNLKVAVTAVPDPKKGERIIVLHTGLDRPVEEILKELEQAGLPNLWLPGRDSFYEVEAIPVLGSGKLDLKALKQTAMDKSGQSVTAQSA
ncbi:AMP-binding protein [Stratiformator vulcanicus]|uniref:Bifunctional protein Aas n=1 Tax=Stratiformator vulcanicus TaxID=2527980 RepID=A0A517R1Y9_9PLAN|nr:AMP-binding protein [Stratiformator vulcanicus]QDT37863.1 Bifunctional protein Aas [Stratiformator vulcanicus]